jgi:hypothetical protein
MNTHRSLCFVILTVLASLRLTAATTGDCSTGMVKGTYFYLLAGTVVSGGQGVPYTELGELVADGSGRVSGESFASVNGQPGTYSLSGTYSVQSTCTGTITLTVNSQATAKLTFQVVDSGQEFIVAISNSEEVVTGRAYSVGSGAGKCSNESLSGNYGYLLTGFAQLSSGTFVYSDAGQVKTDGKGHLTTSSIANVGGAVSNVTATGN